MNQWGQYKRGDSLVQESEIIDMKPRCQNEICTQVAAFTIAGINCCGNHVAWAARKGLEQSQGQEITIAWAAEEAA